MDVVQLAALKVVGHEVEAQKHQKTFAQKYEETASGLTSIARTETTEVIKMEMDAVRLAALKVVGHEVEAQKHQKTFAQKNEETASG